MSVLLAIRRFFFVILRRLIHITFLRHDKLRFFVFFLGLVVRVFGVHVNDSAEPGKFIQFPSLTQI